MLMFLGTRRSAESTAEKISKAVNKLLSADEKKELEAISNKILNALQVPTRQCKREAECIKNGCAFHHAGLVNSQKTLIENAFRSNKIKIICATPTLAYGLNLPARRVVVRDFKRYGSGWIPNLEWCQMAGRACGNPSGI